MVNFCGLQLSVTVSKDDTVILDGAGDKKAIAGRCEQVYVAPFLLSLISSLFFWVCILFLYNLILGLRIFVTAEIIGGTEHFRL